MRYNRHGRISWGAPDIYMPERKEPHFFGADLSFTQRHNVIRELNSYLALYANWQGEHAIGDASVKYLSRKAAQEIKTFAPDARIIIMLRNPVDMMYSVYHQSRYDLNEDLPTFETALAAEPARKRGEQIPRTALLPQGLCYSEIALFSEQVQRYWDVFGRERVHIILFDDLVRDTAQVYRETLAFLGVDPDFTIAFEVINSNKQVRSVRLRNATRSLSMLYRRLLRQWGVDPYLPTTVAVQPFRAFWQRIGARILLPMARFANAHIKSFNTQYVSRQPMADDLRRQLIKQFTPEIETLSALIGRDLSHWTQTALVPTDEDL
jgi:hypothetical protein